MGASRGHRQGLRAGCALPLQLTLPLLLCVCANQVADFGPLISRLESDKAAAKAAATEAVAAKDALEERVR